MTGEHEHHPISVGVRGSVQEHRQSHETLREVLIDDRAYFFRHTVEHPQPDDILLGTR